MSSTEQHDGAVVPKSRQPSTAGLSMTSSLRRRRSTQGLLPGSGQLCEEVRERRIRRAMLACACCLSLGSHFGSHLLGPLKSSLKASESEFAALVSAGSLINTITPLLSGLLVPKFGPARVGMVSTGLVLLGHLVVCWRERAGGSIDIGGMVAGLLLAGAGSSPLSVVQESIILRCSDGNAVGTTVALGLLLGKTASFVSAATSHPMSTVSSRLPFAAAASLSALSFGACVAYHYLEKRLVPSKEDEDERLAHLYHVKGKALRLSELKRFPGRYWLYALGVCTLVGAWDATTRLSSSLLQTFYHLSPSAAGGAASVIPFSSLLLYPLVGVLVDRHNKALRRLYIALPLFIVASYIILLRLTDFVPSWLAFVPSALSLGCGPLLIVIIIPLLVRPHQAPTALGLHKSLEMGGSIITQVITASLLARQKDDKLGAARNVVKFLLALVCVQFGFILMLWRAIGASRLIEPSALAEGAEYSPIVDDSEDDSESETEDEEARPLLDGRARRELLGSTLSFYAAAIFIATSWVVFIYNLTKRE